jgi:hypothetical protein
MIACVVSPRTVPDTVLKIALTHRSTPDPRGWTRMIHPFKKNREPAQNLCENNSWENRFDFFVLAVFLNNSKRFWRLTENPENFFGRARNFRKYFLGKFVHELTRQPELFPHTQRSIQNPPKPQILRGDRNRGHWQGIRQPFSYFLG